MSRTIFSKLITAISLIDNPRKLILPAGQNGLLNFIPDEIYLKAVFKAETGYPLDLKQPKTYNEKLQWIKLYDRNPRYITLADKFKVRKYIKKNIGEKYLVPLIGVYNSPNEIPWSTLPNRFVLKCNHASGTNIICKNKNKLDIKKASKQLKTWLNYNQYWGAREWCYKDIKPCILCEEFIETSDGNTPDDYKFMCFNGEPRFIPLRCVIIKCMISISVMVHLN